MISALQQQGRAVEFITQGTSLTLAHLRNRHERIDWADWLTIAANFRTVWADQDFVDCGRGIFTTPFFRYMAVIARLLFTPEDFYRWMTNPGTGAGNQTFSNIEPSFEKLGPQHVRVRLRLMPGYALGREFFLITLGSFIEIPRVVGLGSATITFTEVEDGAIYEIRFPPGAGLLRRLKQALLWPLTIRRAAHELKEAHEVLQHRYYELQEARDTLELRVKERTAELEAARDALAQSLTEMQRAQDARQRLFQTISHEIRTPLSLVMLAAADIERRSEGALAPRAKQRLVQIDESCRRLLHLFDGMLLLAAGQEGKLRVRPAAADAAQLVRNLVATWTVAAEERSIGLDYHGPQQLPARVDIAGFERVLSNLLSNAVKFTPPGGSVEVRLRELGDRLELVVRDTGVGMDEEFLNRVFGRFEQGPSPVRPGERGSGLGLAIVKDIAEAHGGTVRVESVRGRGSSFIVVLPRESSFAAVEGGSMIVSANGEALADLSSPSLYTPIDPPPTKDGPAPLVLIAEDEPVLRHFLAELLGEHYRVLAAADGLAALRLARQHHPDILISDVGMPGLDGYELAKRFREEVGSRLAPVILLTAFGGAAAKERGFAAGAVDYILKPFQPAELLARVRSQLSLRDLALRLGDNERLASLGLMSAGLAHEIRNPINTIVNALAPLRALLPPAVTASESDTGQLLDVVSAAAEQLGEVARQLLGMAKPGVFVRRPEPVEQLVVAAQRLTAVACREHRVEVQLEGDGAVPCAKALVVQVLVNLLDNAAHASPNGSLIRVHSFLEDEAVVFEVEDEGPGVPVDLRERVFDPFFTTKAPGKGTGLGLTMSRMIAERHGGRLLIVARPKGSAFRLELPRQIADTVNIRGEAGARPSGGIVEARS